MKHTQTPIKIKTLSGSHGSKRFFLVTSSSIQGIDNYEIGEVHNERDAEFIVLACNAHEDLVSALKQIAELADQRVGVPMILDLAQNALTKAWVKL